MCVDGSLIYQYHLLQKPRPRHICVCTHPRVLGPVYLGVKVGFLDSKVTDLLHCCMFYWQHDKILWKKMRKSDVFFCLVLRLLYSKSGSSLCTECSDLMN